MSWDFSTDKETQEQLDWVDTFVRDEVEPLDFVVDNPRDVRDPVRLALVPPLQQRVKEQGLWSPHLPPEWGGQSLGVSDEMPFVDLVTSALTLGVADGPTEVHQVTLARQMTRGIEPAPGLFPTYHLPEQRRVARERYRDVLERCGRSVEER